MYSSCAGQDIRICIVTLVPTSRFFVARHRVLGVVQFRLVHFAHALLVGGGAAEVALGAVARDADVEAAHRRFRVVLAVGFEGVDETVCGVVGLVELRGLDLGCLFKRLAGIDGLSGLAGCRCKEGLLRAHAASAF